jgi:hypothetical protein
MEKYTYPAMGGDPAVEVEVTPEMAADLPEHPDERRFAVWMDHWAKNNMVPPGLTPEAWQGVLHHVFGNYPYPNPCNGPCWMHDGYDTGVYPEVAIPGVENPEAWWASAVRSQAEVVRTTREGDRNNALNRAAYTLFAKCVEYLLPAKYMEEADEVLLIAALDAGLEEREARAVLNSAAKAADRIPKGYKRQAEELACLHERLPRSDLSRLKIVARPDTIQRPASIHKRSRPTPSAATNESTFKGGDGLRLCVQTQNTWRPLQCNGISPLTAWLGVWPM